MVQAGYWAVDTDFAEDVAAVAVGRAGLMAEAAHAAGASAIEAAEHSSSVAEARPEAACAVLVALDTRVEVHNLPAASSVVAESQVVELPVRDGEELFHASCPMGRPVWVHRRVHAHRECCSRKLVPVLVAALVGASVEVAIVACAEA